MIIGIDCSRTRSGGGIEHITNFLNSYNPKLLGIEKIHLWVFESVLKQLPKKNWLKIHTSKYIESNLLKQIYWQKYILPKEAKKYKCSIFLNTDASTFLSFSPSVTMSRDALSFEPGEMKRYWPSFKFLRLLIIKYIQIWSLKKSNGTIFLTKYHKDLLEKFTGKLVNAEVIPHGIKKIFYNIAQNKSLESKQIRIIYVSNIALYKHQWNIIYALNTVSRKLNINFELILAGSPDKGKAQKLLNNAILNKSKLLNVILLGHLKLSEIVNNIKKSNLFIFASSCETISNTLIQGMASGLPIACSNRGPLPEVLGNGGIYFNPENIKSIENAVTKLIHNCNLRNRLVKEAKQRAIKYNWEDCAKKTYLHLIKTYKNAKNVK